MRPILGQKDILRDVEDVGEEIRLPRYKTRYNNRNHFTKNYRALPIFSKETGSSVATFSHLHARSVKYDHGQGSILKKRE